MCQRVMIALALACEPALLIADEPTTGLDITTQAVIMDLIAELAVPHNMATLLITHDLALAGENADRIVVMHAGQVVESAPRGALCAAAPPLYGKADRCDAEAAGRSLLISPQSPAGCPICGARICPPAATVRVASAAKNAMRRCHSSRRRAQWSLAGSRYD